MYLYYLVKRSFLEERESDETESYRDKKIIYTSSLGWESGTIRKKVEEYL
jgi:hypothetical protein